MDKNVNKNEIQNQTDKVDQPKNDSDNQQLDEENKLSNHNKTKFLKIFGITGLIAALIATTTITSVAKFCQPKPNKPDTKPDPSPNPDNSDITPSPNPEPNPSPDDDGDSPTPQPQPAPQPQPHPEPVPPTPDFQPQPAPSPDNNEVQIKADIEYMKSIWNDHFKNKRSSIETLQSVEDDFKYVIERTRPEIKNFTIRFEGITDKNQKLGLGKNYKLIITYQNQTFELHTSNAMYSMKPTILKVIKSFSNPEVNGKILSFLPSENIGNYITIRYEVLQIGYSKVNISFKNRLSRTDIQIMNMPREVKKVPSILPREIDSLRKVFSNSQVDKEIDGIKNWDTTMIKSMRYAFNRSSFDGDLSNWDTSNVIDMRGMFTRSTFNNKSIVNWDTSKVRDMSTMFAFNKAFNQDISTKKAIIGNKIYNAWDTSKVKVMDKMFQDATAFNQNITNWDVSNVIRMQRMFYSAKAFNQDINTKQVTVGDKTYLAWDIAKVRSIKGMFEEAESFNKDIGNWNISSVVNIFGLFKNAKMFNQDINTKQAIVGKKKYIAWDISNITSLASMFFGAKSFNGNIENWDTLNVKNLNNVFRDAESFNRDISTKSISNISEKSPYIAWNVENLETINYGFYHAKRFNQNLSGWNTLNVNRGRGRRVIWDEGASSWAKENKPCILRERIKGF
ncbi:BspA family leucine-rich repeat surface protein [Mycoplasma putrefaciens]|uniref:PARCEL domain protein n=1 Tax=Mycoplasma putrefaciens (strain ATCC 15718 / NCTC 10155 / C30 KS-1 / KS-1) TaxID=743965 RepID=A0A7U3ZSD1_MYCPK|nr:BspA family leucine-rich repeat surface protein [Mycoplasma putrefaciens]AEM68618.1 PARCEL domain protein [Mycoplasma putrefaciens KS1]